MTHHSSPGIISFVDLEKENFRAEMVKLIVDNHGTTLSYTEYGNPNGFPILAQHGLIASIKEAAIFKPLLQQGARVICVARPGYGETPPIEMRNIGEWGDSIAPLVETLGLDQFDVLGMSSGAPYCYAIGSRFPLQARNLYVFSGIPAMYDDEILAQWPFEIQKGAPISEMQRLARDLFFTNLSEEDMTKDEITDAMRNDCFGFGLDFRLRSLDWGFILGDLKQRVYMRHARFDPVVPFITAEMTTKLLAHCSMLVEENDIHFSQDALARFLAMTVLPNLNGED
jgi:pimeloyl-ACP methyl ester carboxylesterase